MKEFLMLIRENPDYGEMTPEEMQKDIERHMKWVEELTEKGNFKLGNPLHAGGKHIKDKSRLVIDGPFVESKECVSGFYFLLAESLEQAGEIAKGCPALDSGGSVEIREILTTEDDY